MFRSPGQLNKADLDGILGKGNQLFKSLGKSFARPSVMTVPDLLQLPPIRGKLIFSQFSHKDCMNHLLGWQLWYLFKYAELTEVFRQNNKLFIDLLNKVQVGKISGNVEELLKGRLIHELMKIIQKMSYTCIQR